MPEARTYNRACRHSRFPHGGRPVPVTLKNESRAEQMVTFLNYLAWARGPDGGERADLEPADLGALAKYVVRNGDEPKDAENNINLNLVELDITEVPEESLVAELIREVTLEGVRDELPHSITVVVEEMGLREDRAEDKPLLDIFASLIVERDSQKGIIIGHRGSRLRTIGEAARHQIEALLGTPVYLDLRVKVLKEWQRDPKHLNRLGF